MSTQPSQLQIYHHEQRRLAERDLLFLQCVRDGLTRADLQHLIDRRPALWQRYAAWLHTLP